MGYKSDVSLTITNADFDILIEKAKQECKDACESIEYSEIFQNSKYTTIYWDWTTWYSDFSEVQFIERFIQDVPHVFHRLGENHEDYEYSNNAGVHGDEFYDMYECASIIRKIDFEGAGERIN
jgi:hypothetical protein